MVYSVENILKAGGHKIDFVEKILQIFVDEADDKISAIQKSIDEKNFKEIESLAHQFKSNLQLLSCDKMAEDAGFIENKAKSNKCDQECYKKLQSLIENIESLVRRIKNDLENDEFK